MKKVCFSIVCLLLISNAFAQNIATPDQVWKKLFEEVQLTKAMGDNKTFVDLVPKESAEKVLKKYSQLKKKDSASLRKFVDDNFYMPSIPEAKFTKDLLLNEHLNELWKTLARKSDQKLENSSLLPLPNEYIVPGGRFREIYYWDSYFTMLGLAVSNRYDMIENMIDNFSYLIQTYGHIPNGNRSYYLSRSQPPFFALMVDLLAKAKGDSIYAKYSGALEKEYAFWMDGKEKLANKNEYRRVVKMPDGSVLNRYYDDKHIPRQESYMQDVKTAKDHVVKDSVVFTHLRAGAESGWDFSSRWFADTFHLNTIETIDIVPVDLNALLFAYENVLSKAAIASGQKEKAADYAMAAANRQKAVFRYCWNADLQYFFDYDRTSASTTNRWSLAGVMPLFTQLATPFHAQYVAENIQKRFLKDGGVVTTIYHTGQQWDAPNGWAPLQYITVQGLENYGFKELPRTIGERWMAVNERVFKATGKMLEKYNVENTKLESGGGEYPTQDGFGWSNGVYLKFYQMFKAQKGF